MGKAFIYVDNSNIYAEGCRVSAVTQNFQGVTNIIDAMNFGITDFGWHLNYVELYNAIQTIVGIPISQAKLWGSPPPNDPFWQYVKTCGFDVKIYEKNASGHEKKVDTAITHQITKDAYSAVINKDEDIIFLLAGDTDYVPMVEDLVIEGFKTHVVFWDHAGYELKTKATSFVSLNPYFQKLTK
ncbi:hypothetical protein AGMMS50267_15070 [Spirochaetia bacterium]|nr:hypothetical protein AGMMS50267_15070 [Spirochaetia bacterium]